MKVCVVNQQFCVNNGFFSREMANNGRIMQCHTKFANHHCWFDALALIMQTGYEVSSLSVPAVIDYTFKE